MAVFSPFFPFYRGGESSWDDVHDHPFLNFNSPFFRDPSLARANRANVSEAGDDYRVEVDVPGYNKGEISIEFGADGRSLTVSGRSEKTYEEGSAEEAARRGVTVEEVPETETKKKAKEIFKKKEPSTAVAQTSQEKAVGQPAGPKYWVSERNVGSFSRTFTFRQPLDTERSSASLENGVLMIVIPKAHKAGIKRISIA